ncbi:MAG: SDR family NAD(P)-dependent oxidoreductase [Rhodoluna sp.]
MNDLHGKTILVVGASGALGSVIASELLNRGAQVLGTTSRNERAESIPSRVSLRLLLDFEKAESIETLVNYLVNSGAHIDGIINAAGVVAFGGAGDLSQSEIQRLLSVNLTGPISLISGLLPLLRNSAQLGNSPFILNISGLVAEQPMANMAAYSAAKAGLWAWGQALTRELRRDGIRVIDARPGHTETGLASRAIAGTAPNFATGMSTDYVAGRIIQAIVENETDLPSTSFKELA